MDITRRYKIFTASPIWISIVHLISILFFQANFSISQIGEKSGYGSFGFLFGLTEFAFSLSSNLSLNAVKTVASITTIIIGISLVFLSYFSLTKNKNLIFISLGIYILDYIFSLAGQIIISFNSSFNINFVSYFFANFIHIVGIGLIAYSLYISRLIKE